MQSNPGHAQSPRLLHHFFEEQAALRPEATAVEFQNDSVTYRDLDRQANRIARALAVRGVGAGDLVALYLAKSPTLFAVMLGILKAGAGYVPIDPRYPIERIRTILEDSGVRAIVTETPLARDIRSEIDTTILDLDDERDAIDAMAAEAYDVPADISPASLCYVIYTSGSTGRPKGVMIEHRNAVAFVACLSEIYRLDAHDRVYQGFSTAFDASVEEIWAAFSRGGTLVVPTEDIARSPADLAEFISARQISYFSTVPTMLSMIDSELPSVRTLVVGGEACPAELVSRWAKPGRRMMNTYGPTEATVVATWSDCTAGEAVRIGRALPGYATYVLNEALERVPPGGSGELYIGGQGVARGYMNLEQLTAERFIPDPFSPGGGRLYRTYDHVRLGEEGELYFLGRLDGQVKIRGFRVELNEIEAVLLQTPIIKAAAVHVVECEGLKDLAAAVVCEPTEGVTLDRTGLAAFLRSRMPEYMIPKYLDVLPDLPVTTSGKIDRKSLPPPDKLLSGDGVNVAPGSELENVIHGVWLKAFGLRQISVEADFFNHLGGHSFLAARTVSLLRRATGNDYLSVRDIYDCRTIRSLAQRIVEQDDCAPAATSVSESHDQKFHDTPPSEKVFRETSPFVRWTTATCQFIVVMVYYSVLAVPLVFSTILVLRVLDGNLAWAEAAWIASAASFAAWPLMLLMSIAVKWSVIGRYRPGRYPLWGLYYLRWWTANLFQTLAWPAIFAGTPLMSIYWRAMGAKIGRNVTINTSHCSAYDVLSIGDNSSIGLETQILGYSVADGYLVIAPVTIGRNCFVGMHCAVGPNVKMGDAARLDDLSLLTEGMELKDGESRRGSPAVHAQVDTPVTSAVAELITPSRRRRRRIAFGLAHLAVIYAMSVFFILVSAPSAALLIAAFVYGNVYWAAAAAFAALPLWLFSYVLGAAAFKRAIGRIQAGCVPLESLAYLRHWVSSYLMENTRSILMPVYGTIYLPHLFRLLGAKVGQGVEMATVSHVSPDLLEVGRGSFLADACLVGGMRIHNSMVEFGNVRIGTRSFVGNSAIVPGGVTVGDGVLIGVSSTLPSGASVVRDNTRWLGSPGFELPNTQLDTCFQEDQLFTPTRAAFLERAATDAARILVPRLIQTVCAITFVGSIAVLSRVAPLHVVAAALPFMATASAYLAIGMTALLKWSIQGAVKPVVKPLWSRFVWHNEFVNGVFETAAAPAMSPLLGTPFIGACLRMMGCKVGRWCFINSTLFSEFDLVEIGDRAAINLGVTIQTHLFEDRIFKADHLKIGSDCSVGNMAVVLYATEMKPGSALGSLSVLMKGETLPSATSWMGIPCMRSNVRSLQAA